VCSGLALSLHLATWLDRRIRTRASFIHRPVAVIVKSVANLERIVTHVRARGPGSSPVAHRDALLALVRITWPVARHPKVKQLIDHSVAIVVTSVALFWHLNHGSHTCGPRSPHARLRSCGAQGIVCSTGLRISFRTRTRFVDVAVTVVVEPVTARLCACGANFTHAGFR